jgi:dihydrofolate reductase/thymidylate synthase
MPDRAVNDLGPVGFQWRHAGAEYIDKDTADYSGFGVDQILNVIDGIKSDPHSRRHVLSAWQVSDGRHGVAPCHSVAVQFYVRDRELSAQHVPAKRRRGPGPPSNIASYAMLTCMIAQVCDLRPGD